MSNIPQTIQQLTGNAYSELRYYQISDTDGNESLKITGDFMSQVISLLEKCDIDVSSLSNTYDSGFEQVVQDFQKQMGKNPTGILDNPTWQLMILYANKYSDYIQDEIEDNKIAEQQTVNTSPHYNSFFGTNNLKPHRRSYKDIKIVFGNNTIVKTIKNVIMRSVSVEVDTSGNPISETYEFIAQDIIESDEPMDKDKYLVDHTIVDTMQNIYPYLKE